MRKPSKKSFRKSFIYSKLKILVISIKDLLRLVFNFKSASSTIFNLLDLYLITRLNYNKYYNTFINFRFNLFINNKDKLICVEIDIAIE